MAPRPILFPTLAIALLPSVMAAVTRFNPRAGVPTTLPGDWSSLGCYSDNAGGVRSLQGANYASGNNMTVQNCINFCDASSFIYAGLEYSQECYCGNAIKGSNTNKTLSDCSMTCSGNSDQTCGAGDRLNVFWSGKQPPPPPMTVPKVGDWVSLGCYSDNGGARTLGVGMATDGPNTIEKCTTACYKAGYPFAGAEYSAECFCGTTIASSGAPTPIDDCSMTCAGNSTQYCGGPGRLNLYNYTGSSLPPVTNPNPPGGGGGGVTHPPVTIGLPTGWKYADCYVDNANGRVFTHDEPDDPTMTVQSCVNKCDSLNYTIAGMEYAAQCFCGNQMVNGATVATGGCDMNCAGNATQTCGGGARLSVYSSQTNLTILPVPITKTTNLPGQWTYQGCYREPGAQRVLPYFNDWPEDNTIDKCLNQCAKFGYPAGGLEYGRECWCGDVEDVTKNGGVKGEDSECQMPCAGDGLHLCGSPERLTLYYWTGTPALYTWQKPANIGRYEHLIGGLVIPLIATVGINNKVTFLEKSGTSAFGNTTGAYELDLTLTHDYKKAWREMHVKSDVFCAASLVLPDKAGRQINIGGWSLDSTKGVRLYTPDGSAGVNGTNDWEENFEVLHLQRQRWYPSAVVLNNGSIFVVGGELGSNDLPEPSVEILPQPPGGPTYINMEWLERTDPNNLYPFLFILPSTRVFVGYYNEARILDPVTFDTVKVLPNMPGNVNNPIAGRTYPMEGSAVMLPQHAPYTAPVEILTCGGATSIPTGGIGLDTCLRIAPEKTNATWEIERAPSKRVMPCMAALPDGTFIILNGAHQGNAGFGLANDPNYGAELYNPDAAPGSRFTILNTTIVARMYHSEATLLPDGRVLVSGSDPNPDGVQVYPEEFRMEVYLPPYLTAGRRQPEFNLSQTNWAYGGQYTLTNVKLYHGTASGVRVSLIAATSSTHGAIMGGRTLFPAVTCAGTTCTVTAPPAGGVCPAGWFMLFVLDGPTPSFAKWVRIGGDPGSLGNWPALPGFTPPGM